MDGMTNVISPELRQFLAAPEVKPVESSAFAAHGFWTFGVVLMRNLRFTAKTLVICTMFLIPLTVFGWFYNTSMRASIEFSLKEHLGVEYARGIFPVLELAQQLRREAAGMGKDADAMAASKEKLSAAQSKLAALEERLGPELNSAKAYKAVQEAWSQTASAKDASAVFKAHTAHIEALMGLMAQVTDASNLTLDPDLDSYFLMDAALFRIPDILETSDKLSAYGLAIMKSGAITPAQQRSISELIPIAEFQAKNMRDGLAKSFAATPALQEKVAVTGSQEGTSAFFAIARKNVIDNQDFTPAAQPVFLAAANRVSTEHYALAQRLLTELDILLEKRTNASKTVLYTVNSIAALGILLAAYFFYCFFRVTRGGLNLISKHLMEIAKGDLRSSPAKPWGHDEPASVIEDLRLAYDELYALIRTVRHSARALHATSEEISVASLDLSSRTEASAASLEEQAAAMEQIGVTVGNMAERARLASDFATSSANVAEQGGRVIESVVHTMQNIHASSAKINDIIGVINGIAFQTNILALNAAVEAARAGEAGRGFAVVASEVRGLAQRSADAAREIKELISNSVDQIASGTLVVEKAGSTMSTMVGNAKQMNDYINDISNSAKEQADGVAQVVKTIQTLDESTRNNALLVDQTAAASAALTKQAVGLQHEIANFRVA
jgi:methyl-accepting chemotaxis protein